MTVLWPDRRADVLEGLAVLAAEPPALVPGADVSWPDLTNAVHWVVDDTSWDRQDPATSIGMLLLSAEEADAIAAVVRAVVSVSDRQGPNASDRA